VKYTIGKSEGLNILPIGFIYFDGEKITFDTEDEFLKSTMTRRIRRGVRKTHCIRGRDGGFGMIETRVNPSDAEYIPYVSNSMPPGYCIIEMIMPKNKKTEAPDR